MLSASDRAERANEASSLRISGVSVNCANQRSTVSLIVNLEWSQIPASGGGTPNRRAISSAVKRAARPERQFEIAPMRSAPRVGVATLRGHKMWSKLYLLSKRLK